MRNAILLCASIVLAGLISGKACAQKSGQTFEQAYENALLDSLIKYELLKPIHLTLQLKNDLLNQKALADLAEIGLLKVQLDLQKQYYEGLLATERKKRRKRVAGAFLLGYATGKLTPPY